VHQHLSVEIVNEKTVFVRVVGYRRDPMLHLSKHGTAQHPSCTGCFHPSSARVMQPIVMSRLPRSLQVGFRAKGSTLLRILRIARSD
jgi:hypothetical protein